MLCPFTESRPVTALTPTQLAQKRARDCVAQRAFRNRRKQRIQDLEQEIEELQRLIAGNHHAQSLKQRNKELELELCQARTLLAQASRQMQESSMYSYSGVAHETPNPPILYDFEQFIMQDNNRSCMRADQVASCGNWTPQEYRQMSTVSQAQNLPDESQGSSSVWGTGLFSL